MRQYLSVIKQSQQVLLGLSILILVILPSVLVFFPELLSLSLLYAAAHVSLFLVMAVRPLADLLPDYKYIRPLVILRKGMGVFSASIIVSFILSKLILDPFGYLSDFGTLSYWSLENLALFAHLADISAILLLVTSNNLSKRLLGANWKRVQKLSYVYFYGGGLYVYLTFHEPLMLFYLTTITILTLLAFLQNKARKNINLATS